MKKCIYTLKTEPEVHFTDREHIFPRCIGGVHKLDRDYVCREFNNEMAKCERIFAQQYPLLAIPRMMEGPQGRPQHKNSGIGLMRVLESNSEGQIKEGEPELIPQFQIGYVENGAPSLIPQIIVPISALDSQHQGTSQDTQRLPQEPQKVLALKQIPVQIAAAKFEDVQKLLTELPLYKGRPEIIYVKRGELNNKILVGWCKKNVYIAIEEDEAKENSNSRSPSKQIPEQDSADNVAEDYFRKVVALFKSGELQTAISSITPDKIQRGESHVEYHRSMVFSLEIVNRVFGKIALNVLARLRGQDFVLRHEFDELRQAIVTGDNIMKFVSFPNLDAAKIWAGALQITTDMHFVLIAKEDGKLIADIVLYGVKGFATRVILSDTWTDTFVDDVYICDWQSKQEYTLDEYVDAMGKKGIHWNIFTVKSVIENLAKQGLITQSCSNSILSELGGMVR